MKRIIASLIGVIVLSLGSVALGQQPAAEALVISRTRVMQGPEGPPPPPDANFVFVASESFGGKVVKGAPYSGEAVTETVQTLADGNRIINRLSSMVYRDTEGRTRREQSFKGLGVLGVGEEPLQMIFIHDPVAGITYSLDSKTRTARKSASYRFELGSKAAAGVVTSGPTQTFEFKVEEAPRGNVIMAAPALGATEGERVPHARIEQFSMRTEGGTGGSYLFRTKTGQFSEVKEDLGKQFVEGVEAEGSRTTITIPAGEIGNERPIQIVSERWYSPELQLVVMTRRSDPRSGETTYRLTNINRAEPARSLFEVPGDYNIKSGPQFSPAVPLPRTKRPE
jgi:hypothetical protein